MLSPISLLYVAAYRSKRRKEGGIMAKYRDVASLSPLMGVFTKGQFPSTDLNDCLTLPTGIYTLPATLNIHHGPASINGALGMTGVLIHIRMVAIIYQIILCGSNPTTKNGMYFRFGTSSQLDSQWQYVSTTATDSAS